MGQVLHGSARNTAAMRCAIQPSQESPQSLATRYGIKPKTGPSGASAPASWMSARGLNRHQRCLAPGKKPSPWSFASTPGWHWTIACARCRPPFRTCRGRHCTASFNADRVSRLPLPDEAGQSPPKKEFKDHLIGYLRVDFAEVQTEEGKQCLFVAIDRTSKAAFAGLHPRAKRVVAAEFPRRVLGKLPYRVHIVLTGNGVQFTPQAQ